MTVDIMMIALCLLFCKCHPILRSCVCLALKGYIVVGRLMVRCTSVQHSESKLNGPTSYANNPQRL